MPQLMTVNIVIIIKMMENKQEKGNSLLPTGNCIRDYKAIVEGDRTVKKASPDYRP